MAKKMDRMTEEAGSKNLPEVDPDERPLTLSESLAQAPRTKKKSLRQYVMENAAALRVSRDEGVTWDAIINLIEVDRRETVDGTSVKTYLARIYPAKKSRNERRTESRTKGWSREHTQTPLGSTTQFERPSPNPTVAPIPNSLPNGSNPYLPKPPPGPKGGATS